MQCIVGTLKLSDHPSNPKLQVGIIDGKQIVVGRHYDDNVLGFYIPEGALIPDKLAEEMWLKGKLAGKQKNRVKAREMQGVFSEGLFYASRFWIEDEGVKKYTESASWNPEWKIGDDVREEVGILG